MIVRDRPGLLSLFFILRGSIILKIMPQLLMVAGLAALVVWADRHWPGYLPNSSGAPFALMGIALSIFLSFRNSACYDRWWEARRHWGELFVANRNLIRQTLLLEPAHRPEREKLLRLCIAFCQALVTHLRPPRDFTKVSPWLPSGDVARLEACRNPPDMVLRILGENLARLHAQGLLSDILFQLLDRTVCDMTGLQAACERIRSTPVPFTYTLLLHRTAYIFCFILPFGFADSMGWATPFAVAVIAYTFFGLDALGDELEEPFGYLPNDLPIAALADSMEINLRQALGEENLPELPQPQNYILM